MPGGVIQTPFPVTATFIPMSSTIWLIIACSDRSNSTSPRPQNPSCGAYRVRRANGKRGVVQFS